MLMKLWTGDWENLLKRMNVKVDEYNVKELGMMNGRCRKFWGFSRNEFWMNIGCLVSAPKFDLGRSRLLYKEEEIKISGNNRKMHSIKIKVDLYEVCLYYIIYCLLFYFMIILTSFTPH